jgi:hypothetical protein
MTVAKAVYEAIIGELERLYAQGSYRGNAHLLAERLGQMVADSSRLVTTEEAGQEIARAVSAATGKTFGWFGG